jgi:hypothetical protein
MKLLTRAEFARKAGISREAINRALKSGRLKIMKQAGKERINLNSARAKEFLKSRPRQRKIASKKKTRKKKQGKQPAKRRRLSDAKVIEKLSNQQLSAEINEITKYDVEKIKLFEQIKQIQLKTKKARNELIDRALVQKVFAKIYTIDVSELRPIGNKLAPEIAAICKINNAKTIIKINEKIEREIFKSLQHVKKQVNIFLKKIDAKKIDDSK